MKMGTSNVITAWRLPDANTLYTKRAERLAALAPGHPMEAYLRFIGEVAKVQQECIHHLTLDEQLLWANVKPWQQILRTLCQRLRPFSSEPVRAVLEELDRASPEALRFMAQSLKQGDMTLVRPDQALFIWSALSVYATRWVAQQAKEQQVATSALASLCPLCQAPPVASVIEIGSAAGLRYLHCSLCCTAWHHVRTQCSCCASSQYLDYWSLETGETPESAVRAESCGDCASYLKIISLEKDPDADPVADDLAHWNLDVHMKEQGFARSGLNPYLFMG